MAFNVNVWEMAGALAAGVALEYFVERNYTGATNQNTASLIEAGVAAASLLGANYVPREYSDALTGVAAGTLGLLGARLSKQLIKQQPSGSPSGYQVRPTFVPRPTVTAAPVPSVTAAPVKRTSVLDM